LFGNLVADSDQLFLPVDIFPPQDLVPGVFSDQFTAAEASVSLGTTLESMA
jgi:hypothetical protein